MRCLIIAGALFLYLVGPASAAPILTFFPGATDFRIESVTEVDIGGTLFDATFHHEIRFIDLLLLPVTPISFPGFGDGFAAASALSDSINAFGSATVGFTQGTTRWHVPHTELGSFVQTFVANLGVQNPLFYTVPATDIRAQATTLPLDEAYVSFETSAVIPEPGTFTLFGIGAGMLGIGWFRRRRKQTLSNH